MTEDSGTAVELPAAHVVPVYHRRQFRPLTGLSGVALFACLFLPAVKGCSTPVYPVEVPPFAPPYVYGLVFALIALARSARGVDAGAVALRVVSALVVLAGAIMVFVAPLAGAIELVIGGGLLAVIGLRGASERRVAATGALVGLLSTIWFGLWSSSSDALVGVYISCASSAGLFVGSAIELHRLMWARGAAAARRAAEQ